MRIILILIAIICMTTGLSAQEINCRYGFSFEISNDPHWGKDKPVITSVYPNSPAAMAGLKPYDIIEAVEGIPVTEDILDDIYLFLNPPGREIVTLTIKNFSEEAIKVKVKKECKNPFALSEEQLATAFAMYAVENTQERLFTCPFETTQTTDPLDFASFKSFDFEGGIDNQPTLAKKINELIKKELNKRGLKYDPISPDLMVHIFYSFNKNPNYKPKTTKKSSKEQTVDDQNTWRYDISLDRMVKFPFLPSGTVETEAQYILKFGFRFEDQKLEKGRVIWECEANELLNERFSVEDFAEVHVSLMAMQFPYVKYGRNVQFRLSKKKYNYTGINYSIDNLTQIASIDPYSPAYKAGIMAYDFIDFIEDKRTEASAQKLTSAYKQFLVGTLKLRDQSTRFVDANGFPDCMEWDRMKYSTVTKAFDNKNNFTVFSYLFRYAPFINSSGNNTCSFKVNRDREKLEFTIRPEIRSEIIIVVE
ncbi:MAG: DUF4136 domain-containing protein [Tannerella sp.]|jgi:hypothetical protein|nr:DUF4136 domain-containing protein [Tannerella sp.]